jgi:tetraacyldisaccharide 4'-kinase
LSRLYGLAVDWRNHRYDQKKVPIFRLSIPVISVGNIVAGGTGKTPTVIFLARWLQARGKRVCIISRGYRRESKGRVVVADGEHILADAAEAGDEPLLLARHVPGAIVVVDADRMRAGNFAIQRFKPDLVLLDDGFQHRRLHRDLEVVTFKGPQDLGNGWLLPAGPLRESLCGLDRADLFWFNGQPDLLTNGPLAAWDAKPRITARLEIVGNGNAQGGELTTTSGLRVILFCGLAKPAGFLQTARQLGMEIVQFFQYKDHHAYRHRDIRNLETAKRDYRADVIVTTDKDWVKIHPTFHLPPYWYRLTAAIQPEDPIQTDGILQTLCCSRGIL